MSQLTHGNASPNSCPKCGANTLAPRYHSAITDCHALRTVDGGRARDSRGGPHLHWLCGACGYDATTACADGHQTSAQPGVSLQS